MSRTKRISAARFAASAAGEQPTGEELDPDLVDLAGRYEKSLHGQGLVDFDDLIAMPVILLARNAELLANYRERFRYVSVDEYQDVDELQYRLLRQLTPPDGNLCAIGDPDQAIYAFRGANVGFFLRFQWDFPAAHTVQLTRNYRSSPVIVAGALAAIEPGTLVPGRELRAMRGRDGDRAKIGRYAARDEAAEAQFVVHTIDTLLGGSSFHSRDSGRVDSEGMRGGLSFDDIAILYRTDAQAAPIMEALAREGLPFQKRSHDRLGNHAGVRAVLRHLPRPGPFDGMPMLLKQAAQHAIDEIGGELLAGEGNRSIMEQVDVIREAIELLNPLAARYAGDPDAFQAALSLGAEIDTLDPRADRISLLTLHAAKGLEFPVVFLVGCVDGLLPLRWPGARGDAADEEEAEERRLFFVGVSRAQSHLYLSHPLRRSRADGSVELRPSEFLDSLGDGVMEWISSAPARKSSANQQLRLL